VYSERGVIEQTNAALCDLMGRSDAELRGTSRFMRCVARAWRQPWRT